MTLESFVSKQCISSNISGKALPRTNNGPTKKQESEIVRKHFRSFSIAFAFIFLGGPQGVKVTTYK